MDKDIEKGAYQIVIGVSGGLVSDIFWQGADSFPDMPNVYIWDYDVLKVDNTPNCQISYSPLAREAVFVLYVDGVPVKASRDLRDMFPLEDKTGETERRVSLCPNMDFVPTLDQLRHMVLTNDARLKE